MFEITENTFIKNGYVKYKDENENTIFVQSERDGSAFKIIAKIGEKKRAISIKLAYPYEELGITLTFMDKKPIEENELQSIYEVASIIERWTSIGNCLVPLFSNNLGRIAAYMSKEKRNTDKAEVELVNKLLTTLKNYEEMNELIDTYVKLANA